MIREITPDTYFKMYLPYRVRFCENKIIIENRNSDCLFVGRVDKTPSASELFELVADKRTGSMTDNCCYMYNGSCNPVNGPGYIKTDMDDYLQRLSVLFQFLGNVKIQTPDPYIKSVRIHSSPYLKVQNGSRKIRGPHELITLAKSQQQTICDLGSIVARLSSSV